MSQERDAGGSRDGAQGRPSRTEATLGRVPWWAGFLLLVVLVGGLGLLIAQVATR